MKVKEELIKLTKIKIKNIYAILFIVMILCMAFIIFENSKSTFYVITDIFKDLKTIDFRAEYIKNVLKLLKTNLTLYCICYFISLIVVIGISTTIIYFIKKVFIDKSEKHKKLLLYFGIYWGIMFVFLLLTWPGIFKGDEFLILKDNLALKIYYMQHYITNLFYIVCRLLISNIAGITLALITIISAIVSWLMYNIEKVIINKKLVWLFLIPLLLFPVIDNNLFPLRNSIVCYLLLIIIFKMIIIYKNKNITNKDIISLVFVSGLIVALKTEYVYIIPIICLMFIFLYKLKLKKVLIIFLSIILLVKIINIPQNDHKNNTYIITSILNPLQNILASDKIRDPKIEEDLQNIDKLIEHEKLAEKASVTNIPAYFSEDFKRFATSKEKIDFIKSSVRLFIYNFDTFMESRWETFKYTSGLVPDYVNHTGHEDPEEWTLNLNHNGIRKELKNSEPLFLNQGLRESVIKILNCRNMQDYEKTNALHMFVYNVIPQVIMLIVVFVYSLIKKNKLYGWVSILCLLQFPVIFLTAPAAFWMYYMPLYMSANMFVTYIIINFLDNRLNKNKLIKGE